MKTATRGDDTAIDGVSLWAAAWTRSSTSAFIGSWSQSEGIPHSQIVCYAYAMQVDGREVNFWAGEVRDGVYAIYRQVGQGL
jgi:hypothetical protein